MEGIQTYLMDLEFNGVEATPTINRLAKEGMFFKNFYPQFRHIPTYFDTPPTPHILYAFPYKYTRVRI